MASAQSRRIYFCLKKKMKKFYAAVALVTFISLGTVSSYGQNMYISTNLLDYINLGTINGEFGLSPRPNWSFYVRGRYNPFSFDIGSPLQNRVASGVVGARYWPWYASSGWFLNAHAGYSKYNIGGIFSSASYEGDAWHLTVGGGYALILSKKFNLDFGLGVQGGYTDYTRYACPRCGKITHEGRRIYIAPGNMLVQLSMIL